MTLVGASLLLLAWVWGNPPGAAPDEGSNWVRAVATAYGNNTGERVVPLPPSPTPRHLLDTDVHRRFVVPGRMAPQPSWGCNRFTGEPATCITSGGAAEDPPARTPVITGVGPYPPTFYAVMGVAARLTGSADPGLYASRLASAAVALALLAIGWTAVRTPWTRVAMITAISPMVVFLSSSVSVSGIEIAAGVAAAAVIGALARRPAGGPWLSLAVTASALATARVLGPVWVGGLAVALTALVGPRALWRRVRTDRFAIAAIVIVAAATTFTILWDVLAAPRTPASLASLLETAPLTYQLVPALIRQHAGVFGWLDTPLPAAAVALVTCTQLLLVVLGLAVAGRRSRLVLFLAVASLPITVVALDGLTQIPTEFRIQARYVMPLSCGVIVLAGSMIDDWSSRRRQRRPGRPATVERWALVGIAVAMLLTQPLAWLVNSRRSAVGLAGPWWFHEEPAWSPPGGWPMWLVAVGVATILLVVGVLRSLRPHADGAVPADEPAAPRTPATPAGHPAADGDDDPMIRTPAAMRPSHLGNRSIVDVDLGSDERL